MNYYTHLIFILILFFLISFSSYSQRSFIDKIHPLQQNPTLKEKVYVHTNKTSYFPEDTIWFKAYVGDTINHPSRETNKLYVNLIDDSGRVIYKKNVVIKKGTGHGEFELNAAVRAGTYYLQAYTNFMRNFGDDHHYLQKITVLGDSIKADERGAPKYDVQLFPEGGHLLEAIKNTIGIKVLVNGKGMNFTGKIVSHEGDSVADFDNEHMGMARCQFIYKAGERYTAHISLVDTLLKIDVPQALKKGLVIHTDNSHEKELIVTLKTNETTFYDQVHSNYTLLYHQDHQIYGLVSVDRLDSTVATIRTDKNIFLDGVNTVTLFDNDQPIAERRFFVEKEHKQVNTDFDRLGTENDSIRYKLRLSLRNKPVDANLSISVLSKNTRAYAEKQNIRSTFLLSSLIKGSIEDPAYYFNTENLKRKTHLDLLLLTQGWTQYSLGEMIAELNPRPKFEFERGFELKGKLHGPILHNRLALIADNYQVIDEIFLNNNKSFRFGNLPLHKGDTVKVSYLDKRGKIIKPDSLRFENATEQSIPFPKLNLQGVLSRSAAKEKSQNDLPLAYEKGTIALEGVTLTDKKIDERLIERRKLIKKYKLIVLDIGKYYDVPVPENFKDADLMSFLKIIEGVSMKNSNGVINYLQVPNGGKALLFIDGKFITSPELPAVSLSMANIENVMVALKLIPFTKESATFIQIFTTDNYKY